METVAIYLAGAVALLLYFIPTAIALDRRHQSAGGIIVLNVFLGWTFVGWVAALAWSLSYSIPASPTSSPSSP